MAIPKQYQWLLQEGAPKMIVEGLKLYGVKEIVGKQHNPTILGWAKELGLSNIYNADEIPWCGLVHAFIAKKADKEPVKDPLWALNWAKFGRKVDTAMLGDTLVFKRPGGGHVGLYVGEDTKTYHVMGGNQDNGYNITRIDKSRLYSINRPIWAIAQPPNVRKIILSATGSISQNEQ